MTELYACIWQAFPDGGGDDGLAAVLMLMASQEKRKHCSIKERATSLDSGCRESFGASGD